MAHYGLDPESVSKVLFPSVKYPKQALARIQKGEACLDIEQIERLAEYAGVTLTDLYYTGTWKGATEDGCLTLLKGPYKAKLNYNGVYLSVYKAGELIWQHLSGIPDMKVQEFVEYLDKIIEDYENGNN